MTDYPKLSNLYDGGADSFIARLELEHKEQWREWLEYLPYISFPATWQVRMDPPFGGALVRFRVKHPKLIDKSISVYLDVYNRLGFMDGPYWEIYPYDGDTYRCEMKHVHELITAIQQIIDGEDSFESDS